MLTCAHLMIQAKDNPYHFTTQPYKTVQPSETVQLLRTLKLFRTAWSYKVQDIPDSGPYIEDLILV